MKRILLLVVVLTAACAHQAPISLDQHANDYVKLNLALGQHDADWVDAYYGPPEWREQAKTENKTVAAIHAEATALRETIQRTPVPADRLLALRRSYLIEQLGALVTKAEMLQGKKFPFEEEARLLYGVTPERRPDSYFADAVASLEKELPGSGPLTERVAAYRKQFEVAPERVDAVMRAALQECRARTLKNISLPPGETFTLEYVKNQPWSGYNWYKGNYTSLIQVNTDLPVSIGRALDLACHEGYPGHHTYNVLLEKNLVRDRGWVEFSIYPLNSPQSLIAEGTGNYGLHVAFTEAEKDAFERDVLFPLAGLDPKEAARFHRISRSTDALAYATSEVARRWLDGEITRDEAKAWLQKYGLQTPERAEQQLKFAERYRSYVINYNLGQDLVRAHVEKSGPDRWATFKELISTPMLPSQLRR
ncbi:MAG TPA: hypothetical protein VEO54_17630 [Thermoanaerobaculia bacterium]|nr:hypothetical protein [Thermoanaerobaculia bacterium]